ncbi:MAG: MBL fold metallo-hydrolase [Candidatus Cloacimonadaceae bacterium]|nr:MBL fold metallo-hydrolase [Candidatus Cloacimonadaceae bacterium]
MKFIILGSGPGAPSLDKHLSSIYVDLPEVKLLFDCGDGTYRRLLEHQITKDHLDAIIISHYHPDHICGIFMVLQMLYLEGRTKPLHLFLPERPAAFLDILHTFYTFEQKFAFNLKIHLVEEIELYYPIVTAAINDHLCGYEPIIKSLNLPNAMQSYSFKIATDNGALVYSSDIESWECIEPLMNDCHTIIVDAIHPKAHTVLKLERYPHLRILLNHGISAELEQWLNDNPNSRFVFTQENLEYHI